MQDDFKKGVYEHSKDFNIFMTICNSRRSVRKYRSEPVRDETVRDILRAVQTAPSAGNLQSFEVVVSRDHAVLKQLARSALGQSFITRAPAVMVFLALPRVSAGRYGARGETLYSIQDATIACTYAMLAAASLGLSSTWVGAFSEKEISQALGTGQDKMPVALLTLGYGAESPCATPRRPLEKMAFELQYNNE